MDKKTILAREVSHAHGLLTALVIVSLLMNALSLYFLMGNSVSIPFSKGNDGSGSFQASTIDPIGIKKALLEIEYAKVGGKENYDIINRAQQISISDPQNPSNIEAMKRYISASSGTTNQPTVTTNNPSTSAGTSNTLPSQIDTNRQYTLKNDTVIEGNPDATITVTEYTDMECPFCLRQFHQTQLKEKLFEKYGDKVNFVFKNSRGVNHAGTTQKALAALCVQKVGGAKSYVQYYTSILEASPYGGTPFSVSRLGDLTQKIGVDMTAWQKCYDNKETMSLFEKQTGEAEGYGLSGTPGTRIVNNKTGKSDTVEGAYPFDTFTQKIDNLLK